MSENQPAENAAGQLPELETAYGNLFDGVHSQVFFGRLAAGGVQPANEKEAEDLFKLAGRLRIAEEQEKIAGDSRFSPALSALDVVMGVDESLQKAAYDAQEYGLAVKQAAAELAEDPVIYNSVLALKAAEASVLASQLEEGGQN